MNIIIGHTNMDLDCFGSMALIRYLYPDYKLVQSHLVHPAARNLFNLYRYRFNFINAKDLKGQTIENIVIVDTRSKNRVKEYFEYIENVTGQIIVYDHHPGDENDIEGAVINTGEYGANVTFIGLELMKQGIRVEPEDATIALTGIYSDTGNFQHENITNEDFKVASYLIENNASIKLVKKLQESLIDKQQVSLFHEILNRLTHKNINGHTMVLSYLEMDSQIGGLAAVIEKIFDVERSEAIFCVFHFRDTGNSLIIARTKHDDIKLNKILKTFGGGGHERAASALIKDQSGMMVFANLEEHLKMSIAPAIVAEDIMVSSVEVIKENMTLLEASMFLENINHTGAPVLTQKGEIIGLLTLRDIMKGRKNNQMNSTIKGYMSTNLVTATKDVTITQIEELLFQNNIGHLPIVRGKSLLGIITRTDYLKYMSKTKDI